jgi:hypothetical protein
MTQEEYATAFRHGADAMRGRIAAWLVMQGMVGVKLAPLVLTLTSPEAKPPEQG